MESLKCNLLKYAALQLHAGSTKQRVMIICSTLCRYLLAAICRELNKPSGDGKRHLHAAAIGVDTTQLSFLEIKTIFERYWLVQQC